jgi:hypothetical protein
MTRSKSDVVFLLVLLAASLGFNLWVARRANGAGGNPRYGEFHASVGRSVPVLSLKTLAGEPISVKVAGVGRPTVVYALKPSCVWCARNMGNVKHMVASTKDKFTFVGVSLEPEGVEAYVKRWALDFPVYVEPSTDTLNALGGLDVTPQTIVITPQGVVQKIWDGAYLSQSSEIEKFFGLSLPGLQAQDASTALGRGCVDPTGGHASINSVAAFKDGLKRCSASGSWMPLTSAALSTSQ